VSGLSAEEQAHRKALKSKIVKEIEPYVPGAATILPGLGPHAGFPEDQQKQIPIPEALVKGVAAKIVRGCEYKLGEERLIEKPYELSIHFAEEANISEVIKVFDHFSTPVHLGPGFKVRRAVAHDEPKTVLYKIDIGALGPSTLRLTCPPKP
jgi:hypothetical protein